MKNLLLAIFLTAMASTVTAADLPRDRATAATGAVVRTVPTRQNLVANIVWVDDHTVLFNGDNGVWLARVRPAKGDRAEVRRIATVTGFCYDRFRRVGYLWPYSGIDGEPDDAGGDHAFLYDFTVQGVSIKRYLLGDLGPDNDDGDGAGDGDMFPLEKAGNIGCRVTAPFGRDELHTYDRVQALLDGHGTLHDGYIYPPRRAPIDLGPLIRDRSIENLNWSAQAKSYWAWDRVPEPTLRYRMWDERTQAFLDRMDTWEHGNCRAFHIFAATGELVTICLPYIARSADMALARRNIYARVAYEIQVLAPPFKSYRHLITDCFATTEMFVSPDERAILYVASGTNPRTMPNGEVLCDGKPVFRIVELPET